MSIVRFPYPLSIPQADATVFDRWSYYDYGAPLEPATVLAHAYGDVTGAVLDFKSQIQRATTATALHEMREMLTELREMIEEQESASLNKADAMGTGSAA